MLKNRNSQPHRQGAGVTAWRIVVALLALCLVAASCTSTDDASVDGDAGTTDSDSITQSTAAASSDRERSATADEDSDDMADEQQTGALDDAAAEEDIEAAVAEDAGDEEMAVGGGLSQSDSEHSAEPEVEPYEPTQRRRTEPDQFVDYGVNPFVDTDDDPFSTFALDVDTASYTIARNFLDGGQLPPFEAVRVEEFVNYFDGGYDDEIDEFTISVDAAPSPFADTGDLLLRVGVQAPHVVSDAVRPDSIIVVLDSSGSMNQEIGTGNDRTRRIELVYDAVDLLLEGLEPETRVGVVAYADWARTVSRPAAVGRNHDDLIRRIERDVRPSGSTNVADGLVAGYRMAESEADAGRDVLVLLFSDGVANVGATETDRILRQLGERADIGLSTIGVGLGPFNDELMEQLANRADGSYHYIDDHDEAWRLLGDDVTSFVSVAARDAKVQVIFNPDTVAAYRLLGFENRDVADRDFRNDAVDAGEVAISQSATALYELTLVDPDARSRRSSETLAKVTLRYQRPASENITEVSETIRGSDARRSFDNADRHFRLAAVAAEFAEVLRQSWFVDDPLMRTLRHEAEGLARDFRGDADVAELAQLITAAQRLG
ncbi:MAG: von Willebrand factor type A domain-containing protein [Acidimicrobiaceae bacterium]|nr:von Willebrand factor type A domain-containing protein [Acidimicrobiaceae bacterium]